MGQIFSTIRTRSKARSHSEQRIVTYGSQSRIGPNGAMASDSSLDISNTSHEVQNSMQLITDLSQELDDSVQLLSDSSQEFIDISQETIDLTQETIEPSQETIAISQETIDLSASSTESHCFKDLNQVPSMLSIPNAVKLVPSNESHRSRSISNIRLAADRYPVRPICFKNKNKNKSNYGNNVLKHLYERKDKESYANLLQQTIGTCPERKESNSHFRQRKLSVKSDLLSQIERHLCKRSWSNLELQSSLDFNDLQATSSSDHMMTETDTSVNSFTSRINLTSDWVEDLLERSKKKRMERQNDLGIINANLAQIEIDRLAAKARLNEILMEISSDGCNQCKRNDVKFRPITTEEQAVITHLHRMPGDQALISKFKLTIKARDIATLQPDEWVNDEIINFYLRLLAERSEQPDMLLPSVHAMNTFFLGTLLRGGYNAVKRWTLHVDLFSKDLILIPEYVCGAHWALVIIDLRNRTILSYDSMLTQQRYHVLKVLLDYLSAESEDKLQKIFNCNGYHLRSAQNIPKQGNCDDCGVFCCMYAEYVTRNAALTFTQSDMPYFRQKMILEIINGKLWN